MDAGAGDGVAGGCDVVDGAVCAGAAGGAGVPAVFAGVEGSDAFDGAAFGCELRKSASYLFHM